jgi:hypothetical protein
MALHNLACEHSTSIGDSDAVLSGAVEGCNTWDDAGVTNGESVHYVITTYSLTTHRPVDREVGTGTYTTSTKVVARTTVVSSTNGGSKITMTGLSDVAILPQASEIGGGGGGGVSFAIYANASPPDDNITNGNSASVMNLDTEAIDADNLFTLSSDVLTVADSGLYYITASAIFTATGTFGNGIIYIYTDSDTANSPPPYWWAAATIQTTADSNKDEWNVTFAGPIELDAGDTLWFTTDNNSGVTINAGLVNVRIDKLA